MTEDGEDEVIITSSFEIFSVALEQSSIELYHVSCFGISMVLAEKLA